MTMTESVSSTKEMGYSYLAALKAVRGCKVKRDVLLRELRLTEFSIGHETILCMDKKPSDRLVQLEKEKSALSKEILELSKNSN